jgi:DNA-binding GntR family transcriptional regulator
MLLDGDIKPGTQLVQRLLAKKLSTTTTPVREALSRLESEGLVERMDGKSGLRATVFDSAEVYGRGILRRALESEAARLCAEKATDSELSLIMDLGRECDNALKDENGSLEEREKLDMRFHYAIIHGARCPLLEKEYMRLQIAKTYSHVITKENPGPINENHLEIAEFLAQRKAEKAVKAVQKHIDHIIDVNMKFMRQKELMEKFPDAS